MLDADVDVTGIAHEVLVNMPMDIELSVTHLVWAERDMAGDEVVFLEFTASPQVDLLEGIPQSMTFDVVMIAEDEPLVAVEAA